MKKRIFAFVLALCLLLTLLPTVALAGDGESTATDKWDGSIATGFAGGTGTATDPYQIATGAQLAYLAQQTNSKITYSGKCFKLTADIDLNGKNWTPIGNKGGKYFEGSFDGGNHTISNLKVENTSADYQGLFGWCDSEEAGTDIVIKNLTVSGNVSGKDFVGGVIGHCYGKNKAITVSNCHFIGDVSGSTRVGGVIGYCRAYSNSTIMVENCTHSGGTVTGNENMGGVVGYFVGGGTNEGSNGTITVTGCANSGAVSGSKYVGGVVGYFAGWHESSGTVKNCANSGTVTGSQDVGGVVGMCQPISSGTSISVESCLNTGTVSRKAGSDKTTFGAVTGKREIEEAKGTITFKDCYYLSGCIATDAGFTGDPDTGLTALAHKITTTSVQVYQVYNETELLLALSLGAKEIQLMCDIACANTLICKDATLTLDLNGHVLSFAEGKKLQLEETTAAPKTEVTLIDSNPDATHADSSLPKGGVINGDILLTRESDTATEPVTLHANGGTVTGTVTLCETGVIDCTNGTPTAFMGSVADAEDQSAGSIQGGIFYGAIEDKYLKQNSCAITFMNGNARYAFVVVKSGATATAPTAPTREGYTFGGWYTDVDCTDGNEYPFGTAVRESITLYAKWLLNTYTVTYVAGANGTGTVAAGTKTHGVDFTLSADTFTRTDYTQTGWATSDGGELVYALGGTYTDNAAVTLYPVWTQNTADDLAWLLPVLGALDKEPFDDVTTRDWFYDDVHYVNDHGLMTGTGNRIFGPDAPVTRGMVMTILARREGIKTDRYSPWYAAGVEWAVANGISDGSNPEAPITREELATMLYRYAKLKGYDLSGTSLTGFSDANSVSGYAVSAMQWAVHSGLINGAASVNAGKLLPQSTATRAQLAAMLHRFFG